MIGIVILNYRNWEDTFNCINSIFKTIKDLNYHIYLVDNASPNKPSNEINKLVKNDRITFIQNEKNKGYSAGNNLGIMKAMSDGCKELLISNNDIVYKKDSIKVMSDYLKNNSDVGIVGPKIFLPSGKVQEINMGIKTNLEVKYKFILSKTFLSPLFKKFKEKFSKINNDLSAPFEVHSVSGCCFMISEDCSKDIMPLDESPFLYQEELILGVKMEEKGHKTVYLANSEVVHRHGQSTKNTKAFSYICLVESEIYYFRKYIKSRVILLLPLFTIRTFKFLFLSLKYEDYRCNFKKYFSTSFKMLFKKTI